MKQTLFLCPDKYYTLGQVVKLKIFPWILSYHSLRRLIKIDMLKNDNKIFNVILTGTGRGRRYLIKGSILLALQDEVKKGKDFNE